MAIIWFLVCAIAAFGLLFSLIVLLYPPYWWYYLVIIGIWILIAYVRRKSATARQ